MSPPVSKNGGMNTSVLKLLLAAATLAIPALSYSQTPFTYQGKLDNNGAAFTGNVYIRLGIYATAGSTTPIRQEVMPNVLVTNGIFTVAPLSFTAADFPGAARWLQIEVASDGVNYTPLTPRQQVTWTPYALHAAQAASATTVSGSVPASQLTGTISPALMGGGTINQTINFGPASGAPFTVGGTTKVTNLNSDLFDGFDSAAFLQKSGGTMTGPVSFGAAKNQHVVLYNDGSNTYGIGVQDFTQYFRSGDRFAWYQDGVHVNTAGDPGTGGSVLAGLTTGGLHLLPAQLNTGAQLAIGDNSSITSQPFIYLREPAGEDDVLEISAKKVRITTQNAPTAPSLTFGQTTGQHLVLYESATDTYGIGVQTATQYFRTGEQFAWFKDGVHSDTAGSAGAGGSVLATLSGAGDLFVNGEVRSQGVTSGVSVLNRNDLSKRWTTYSRNSGGVNQLAFWSSASGDVAAFSPNGDLYLVGALTTSVLTIRGGADVAEPFEMTEPETMEPGSVVIIDEDNPGRLKLSREACDTRVAGIISGAGGVKPGLRLHQEGVLEGDHHVALSGRVYVKADASLASIKPGDLLTTSDLPGHAMKVRDHDRAQGAILGKAMSKLDKGTGLVLVLVTLQ